MGFVRGRLAAIHCFDAVVASADSVGGANAYIKGVSTVPHCTCQDVGGPKPRVRDEVWCFDLGGRVACGGDVKYDLHNAVMATSYLSLRATKSMSSVGSKGSFAATHAGDRVGGPSDAQPQAHSFGMVPWV